MMVFLWTLLGLVLLFFGSTFAIWGFAFYHHPGGEVDTAKLPEAARKYLEARTKSLRTEKCERVWIRSYDGLKLSARLYPARENAPMVIACHGYRGSADFSFACVYPIYKKLGFRVLVIDQRAHGQSEGRTVTLGVKEHRDVISWMKYMRERFGDAVSLTLWGVSMGGTSVLNASAASDVKPTLVVSDCAFTSPVAISKSMVAHKIPFARGFLLWITRCAARIWGGFSLMEADAAAAVKKLSMPVLFIHGEEDRFVPYAMGKELFAAAKEGTAPANKEFLSVPDAKHARSSAIHPELYEKGIASFLQRHLGF